MLGILIVYVIAIVRKDVPVFIPYISDAGGSPPQSGLFSILLVTASFCILAVTILRFYSVKEKPTANTAKIQRLNKASMICGLISGFGLLVVATNPVRVASVDGSWLFTVLLPHSIGAFMAFIVGCVYLTIQTVLTFKLKDHYDMPKSVVALRIIFNAIAIISLILMVGLSNGQLPGSPVIPTAQPCNCTTQPMPATTTSSPTSVLTEATSGDASDATSVPSSSVSPSLVTSSTTPAPEPDSGKTLRQNISILMEWFLAYATLSYFLTFFGDFKQIVVKVFIFPTREDFEKHENPDIDNKGSEVGGA